MDAFSAAVCKGIGMRKLSLKSAYLIALFFGGFQALMPLLGWLLGNQLEAYITAFDHWLAFILLSFIGGKMIYESFKAGDEGKDEGGKIGIKELLTLSVATSIDALAMGVTFASLGVPIIPAVTIIGVTTFVLSLIGVIAGNKFGDIFKGKAELAGGVVLILIGVKILVEHL